MLAQLESSTRLEGGGGGEEGELACALRLTTHSRGEAVTAAKQLRSTTAAAQAEKGPAPIEEDSHGVAVTTP